MSNNRKEMVSMRQFLYHYVKEILISGMGMMFPVCEIDPLPSGVGRGFATA